MAVEDSAARPARQRAIEGAQLDHLVVFAHDLEQGVAWCEATLGVTPGPGGEHPFMGTHNRLLKIDSATHPAAYLEIIAINSRAKNDQRTSVNRWFDMDSPALQHSVAASGPRLIHFVARVPHIEPAVAALAALGIDRGRVIEASRQTAVGALRWRISVRDDGQRLFDGALPTLIEWGAVHPAATMAASGLSLESLVIEHPEADALQAAFDAIGLADIGVNAGPARIAARLTSPRGSVELSSLS
ncbi:MAG: VOC family protein [Burkholderiales bacterium]